MACVSVCMCMYLRVYASIFVYVCVCFLACMFVYVYVCLFVFVCVCLCNVQTLLSHYPGFIEINGYFMHASACVRLFVFVCVSLCNVPDTHMHTQTC